MILVLPLGSAVRIWELGGTTLSQLCTSLPNSVFADTPYWQLKIGILWEYLYNRNCQILQVKVLSPMKSPLLNIRHHQLTFFFLVHSIYLGYIYFFPMFFFFLNFPSICFYYFPSVSRTSISHSIRVHKLLTNTFNLPGVSWFLFHS